MTKKDAIELLQTADPMAAGDRHDWAYSPEGEAIYRRVLANASGAKRKSSRPRLIAAAGVAALATSLVAAGYAGVHREVTEPRSFGCYEKLDQQADTAVFSKEGHPNESPVEVCRSNWSGVFGKPAPDHLVTCVTNYLATEGGALAVFPAPKGMSQADACAAIGAALPPRNRRGFTFKSLEAGRAAPPGLLSLIHPGPPARKAVRPSGEAVLASERRGGFQRAARPAGTRKESHEHEPRDRRATPKGPAILACPVLRRADCSGARAGLPGLGRGGQ